MVRRGVERGGVGVRAVNSRLKWCVCVVQAPELAADWVLLHRFPGPLMPNTPMDRVGLLPQCLWCADIHAVSTLTLVRQS